MTSLFAKDLTRAELLDNIERYHWAADTFCICFTPAKALIDHFSFDRNYLEPSIEGRIFSKTGELRWKKMDDDCMRTVFLGQEFQGSWLDDASKELTGLTCETEEILLWGIKTEGKHEWIEQQTPVFFDYPVNGTQFLRGRVVLVVEKWLNDACQPLFCRYHSLKEIEEE